jgi:hypothetical protein
MLDTHPGIDREHCAHLPHGILGSLQIFLARIQLLVLSALAREEDQSCFVSLEALNVRGEGFSREVLAAGIDGDTNRRSKLSRDTSFLWRRVLASEWPFPYPCLSDGVTNL